MAPALAAVMVGSLVLYVLLGGADYGAGFWDLLSSGPLKERQKKLIAKAIQPIWEANHVWLILIFVLLFAGFPRAFGAIMIALFVPILLLLLGIVLRGSSFVFRAFSTANPETERLYGFVFSASSSFTPIFAGMVIASLSDDHLLVAHDESVNGYLLNWVNPFSIAVGMFTLALFAYLAAAYLAAEVRDDQELQRSFCRRALAAEIISAGLAVVVFLLSGRYAGELRAHLMQSTLAGCAEVLAGLSFAAGVFALAKDHVRVARATAALFAASIVAGWAGAQYPYLARPNLTVFNGSLADNVIRDVFFASIAGAVILFPSLALLLYVFKDQRRQQALAASLEEKA